VWRFPRIVSPLMLLDLIYSVLRFSVSFALSLKPRQVLISLLVLLSLVHYVTSLKVFIVNDK